MANEIDWDRSIFLAHSSRDKPRVRELFRALRDHGLEPWLDEEMLAAGAEWDNEIRSAIRRSRFFLACLSRESVTKQGYVQRELRLALQILEEKPPHTTFLIPGLMEDIDVPDIAVGTVRLTSYQYVRLYDPKSFARLVESLKQELKITPDTEATRARRQLESLGDIGGAILSKVEQFMQEVGVLRSLGVDAYKRGDYSAAFEYFRTAYKIDRRSVVSVDLAILYAKGQGAPEDPIMAVQLLEEAIEAGHVRAKTELAHLLLQGTGVRQDQPRAVSLLYSAADDGDAAAIALLAIAYLGGEGVPKDETRGIALMRRAAELGNAEAQSTLSMLYDVGGLGVGRNLEEAIFWARAAAAQGDVAAREYLERIAVPVVDRFKDA